MGGSIETSAAGQERRLRRKTQDQRLATLAVSGAGISPWEAQVLVEVAREVYCSEPDDRPLRSGEMRYECVAASEGAGKPLAQCQLKTVVLTILSGEDQAVLREGQGALRRHRIVRWTEEAREQGGLLSQEDLAQLLSCDVRTVRRDVAEFRSLGIVIATRGQQKDIGPTVSHKAVALRHWLSGEEPVAVARAIKHTLHAVERYIQHFSRVVYLHRKKFAPLQIAMTVGISSASVQTYLDLYYQFKEKKDYGSRFEEIDLIGQNHFLAEEEKKGALLRPAPSKRLRRNPAKRERRRP
jgi:hypothetical protein